MSDYAGKQIACHFDGRRNLKLSGDYDTKISLWLAGAANGGKGACDTASPLGGFSMTCFLYLTGGVIASRYIEYSLTAGEYSPGKSFFWSAAKIATRFGERNKHVTTEGYGVVTNLACNMLLIQPEVLTGGLSAGSAIPALDF
jgi:hypothetical protein